MNKEVIVAGMKDTYEINTIHVLLLSNRGHSKLYSIEGGNWIFLKIKEQIISLLGAICIHLFEIYLIGIKVVRLFSLYIVPQIEKNLFLFTAVNRDTIWIGLCVLYPLIHQLLSTFIKSSLEGKWICFIPSRVSGFWWAFTRCTFHKLRCHLSPLSETLGPEPRTSIIIIFVSGTSS